MDEGFIDKILKRLKLKRDGEREPQFRVKRGWTGLTIDIYYGKEEIGYLDINQGTIHINTAHIVKTRKEEGFITYKGAKTSTGRYLAIDIRE